MVSPVPGQPSIPPSSGKQESIEKKPSGIFNDYIKNPDQVENTIQQLQGLNDPAFDQLIKDMQAYAKEVKELKSQDKEKDQDLPGTMEKAEYILAKKAELDEAFRQIVGNIKGFPR